MIGTKSPKISIITPSFNQGQFIEQTILSVLEQNYPNLEYIIIDGGSNDKTLEIIKKYSKHLTYWTSEKDNGQSHAINKGIQRCTGEIVNWLNSDDYYMPGALMHVAKQFENPLITAYCGRSRVFSDINEHFSSGTDIYPGNLNKTIGWARIDQPETFFKRSVWNKVGLLNEEFHYIMDKEWWIRYLIQYGLEGIIKDEKVIVNFRIHSESKTGSQKDSFENETKDLLYSICVKNKLKDYYKFLEDHYNVSIKNIDSLYINNEIDKHITYFFFYLFCTEYAKNKFNLAKGISRFLHNNDLAKADKKTYKKLNFRMKVMPTYIKQLINMIQKQT